MGNVYEQVTDEILKMLDAGTIPWRMPWKVTGEGPTNITSGKRYTGGNWMFLGMLQQFKGYGSNLWGTYKQVQGAGGQVRKGEKSAPCVFYSPIPAKDGNGQPVMRDGEQVYRPCVRSFRVFNLDQCDGLDDRREPYTAPSILDAQGIADSMPKPPHIVHGGERACYVPGTDTVFVPNLSRFDSETAYWCVVFHELAHSTGHTSRLDRFKGNKEEYADNGHAYSAEELVAEFAASYLCGAAGVERQTVGQSASYIDHWRSAIADNKNAVGRAIGHACKAADYILGKANGGTNDKG